MYFNMLHQVGVSGQLCLPVRDLECEGDLMTCVTFVCFGAFFGLGV